MLMIDVRMGPELQTRPNLTIVNLLNVSLLFLLVEAFFIYAAT